MTPAVTGYGPAGLATSLRNCGDGVTIGGLAGLLALAGGRLVSLHAEGGAWVARIAFNDGEGAGQGATIALALANACEDLPRRRGAK